MSATNRGGKRSEADFYATPFWCVHRLLEKIKLPGGFWLEPGAGEGNIIRAASSVRKDVNWTALELREECRPILETCADQIVITDQFLADLPPDQKPLAGMTFDVGIGNPPFSLAQEFILESLKYCDNVLMLLRLNYLGTIERAPWMQKHTPDIYVLPDRPSFTGWGSDSIEYAWFHWRKNELERSKGKLVMLDLTPKEVRAAQKAEAKAKNPHLKRVNGAKQGQEESE
jgi:hypothetical protein